MLTSLRYILLIQIRKDSWGRFVLHNGVTCFNASASNTVQKSSTDRSSGGISADLVDARQSSSLRMFSKPASWWSLRSS